MNYHKQRQLRMLKHCLDLASVDQAYALFAAANYERNAQGCLNGLYATVEWNIDRQNLFAKEDQTPTQGGTKS